MSKTGSTKNRILSIIAKQNRTLTDLSRELSLAPSTVSQHLQELVMIGAIEEIENPHFRKWKYYRINPNYMSEQTPGIVVSKVHVPSKVPKIMYYVLGLLVAGGLVYLLLGGGKGLNATGTLLVPITLTDPPHVPAGTQALVITYSSVSAHTEGTSGSGWVTSNTSGSVDLMSLLNVSQVIAGVNVQQNATINMVRFNITSAKITINGVKYNVTVPSGKITAHVTGGTKVNSTSKILLDLSPTVAAIYTNTSTVFVMVPAVKAIIVGKANSSATLGGNIKIGERENLDQDTQTQLTLATTNISITNTKLTEKNGNTTVSLTVKNNGNQNVTLDDALLFGHQSVSIIIHKCIFRVGENEDCKFFSNNRTVVVNATARITNPIPIIDNPCGCNGRFCRECAEANLTVVGTSSSRKGISDPLVPTRVQEIHQVIGVNDSNIGADTGSQDHVGPFGSAVGTRIGSSVGASTGTSNLNNNLGIVVQDNENANSGANLSVINTSTSLKNRNSGGVHVKIIVNQGSNITNASNQISLNGSALLNLIVPKPEGNANVQVSENELFPVVFNIRAINFIIESNGTLELANTHIPQLERPEVELQGGEGFTLKPGQSATFTYSGSLTSDSEGHVVIEPVVGDTYKLIIQGNNGTYATANVTATSG